jgi:hypothetical protein
MRISAHTRTYLSSDEITDQIETLLGGLPLESGTISDQAAVTIASWYQSPRTGRAFAEFASTGEVDAGQLLADIGTAVQDRGRTTADLQELMALFAWVTVQQVAQAD